MAKKNTTARALAALEEIARRQPIGVSDLARILEEDKSAMQRALLILEGEGWIQRAAQRTTQWELSNRIYIVGSWARKTDDLAARARPIMTQLRDHCGETIILNVPSGRVFMVAEVVESRQMVRSSSVLGMAIPPDDSATGRVMLAHRDPAEQLDILGHAPDAGMLEDFAAVRQQGYFVSRDSWGWASDNIAAPIFDIEGRATAALVITAPSGRVAPEECRELGERLARAAGELSSGRPA